MSSTPKSFTQTIIYSLKLFLRFVQLVIIFSPTILLSPLYLFKATQDVWFWVFVRSVEVAGVVWIKTFQYMSHRRDIVGDKVA